MPGDTCEVHYCEIPAELTDSLQPVSGKEKIRTVLKKVVFWSASLLVLFCVVLMVIAGVDYSKEYFLQLETEALVGTACGNPADFAAKYEALAADHEECHLMTSVCGCMNKFTLEEVNKFDCDYQVPTEHGEIIDMNPKDIYQECHNGIESSVAKKLNLLHKTMKDKDVKVGNVFSDMNLNKCHNGPEFRALMEENVKQHPTCAHHPHCDCILDISETEIQQFDCYLHFHNHPDQFFNPMKIWEECDTALELSVSYSGYSGSGAHDSGSSTSDSGTVDDDGSGDGGCYEESQIVTTKDGEKMLKDLKTGEFVKTCEGGWSRFWNDYERDINYEQNGEEPIEFYSFHFSNDKNLQITGNHLFEKIDHTFIRAEKVKLGDQIVNIDGIDEKILVEDITIAMGYPSIPSIANHRIIVNGLCATRLVDTPFLWHAKFFMEHFTFYDDYIVPNIPQFFFTYIHQPLMKQIRNKFVMVVVYLTEFAFFTFLTIMMFSFALGLVLMSTEKKLHMD
jgi:hypothetical protein